MRSLHTGERTNIQAGDLVSLYFDERMKSLLMSVGRGTGKNLVFEGTMDDNKTFIPGYKNDQSGAEQFIYLLCQITGLQADLKRTENTFVLYEMLEGPSIFKTE